MNPNTPAAPAASSPTLRLPLLLTLATGAGLSVASIYYSQPLLPLMGADLHASVSGTGLIPTLTQIGYALGILLLVPLGDRFDRRLLILIKCVLLAAALLWCGVTGSLMTLLIASLATGVMATLAQDIVPASAGLVAPDRRGKTVGTVMTGLLAGILLSRTLSGVVAAWAGWRAMYVTAAVLIILLALTLWRVLPAMRPQSTLPYPALLRSMATLWRQQPTLRRAAWAQALLSVSFSAFWSTLAVMLHEQFGLGSAVAGAFGLAGAAGALAAPLAGSLADRIGPARVTQAGAALVTLAFGAMFLMPLLPATGQIGLLIVTAIVFDFGLQAALVAHQTLVYGIDPAARGRLNALLFTVVFIGMALGSALGSVMLAHVGWSGVVGLATVSGAAALVLRSRRQRPARVGGWCGASSR